MYVWMFALLFAVVFGALGYGSGAIRTIVALIGTVIALAVSGPLGDLLHGLTDRMTTDNLVLQYGLPHFLAFVIVWLVIYGMGFAAHHPVNHHFKYREDDATRAGFEKVNQSGGLVVGLFIALILFFSVGKRVYTGGYLSAQTAGETGAEPTLVKVATEVRRHMETSGWDKTFAALDETPARFYEVSDMLGLLHANPAAQDRLRDYPPFLEMEEKPEFADLPTDEEFKELLKSKAGFSPVLNHARTKAVLANPELTAQLLKTDLKDLEAFLKSGVSPKYADEKLLGRWRVDLSSVLLQTRRMRGTMTPPEFAALRAVLTTVLGGVRMKVFTDGRFVLANTVAKPAEGADGAPAEPVVTAAAGGGLDPALAARYGLGRGTAPSAAAAAAGVTTKATQVGGLMKVDVAGEGNWVRGDSVTYQLTGPNLGGKPLEAKINELGRLVIPVPSLKLALVFVRAG
jgi:hypothetical protein